METIQVNQLFQTDAASLWKITGDFGGLKAWLPGVQECLVEGSGAKDQGGDAIRIVRAVSGDITKESLESLDETNFTYQYKILSAKGFNEKSHYLGTFSIIPRGEDTSEIQWQAEFSVPPMLTDEQKAKVREGISSMYLNFLKHLESVLKNA